MLYGELINMSNDFLDFEFRIFCWWDKRSDELATDLTVWWSDEQWSDGQTVTRRSDEHQNDLCVCQCPSDGRTVERTNEQGIGRTSGRANERKVGRSIGRTDVRSGSRTNGRSARRPNGRTVGRKVGHYPGFLKIFWFRSKLWRQATPILSALWACSSGQNESAFRRLPNNLHFC